MSIANGKADDGSALAVPVVTFYQERVLREEAESRAASALARAEAAEKRLREMLELLASQQPDSALGRRAALQLQLAAVLPSTQGR